MTVALFHFDNNGNDLSGNGFDLTAAGSVSYQNTDLGWMTNPSGTSVRFQDADDRLFVSIPDELLLPNTGGEITLEWQMKVLSLPLSGEGGHSQVLLGQSWNNFLEMYTHRWASPQIPVVRANGQDVASEEMLAPYYTGDWFSVRITLDSDGNIRTFIQGNLISEMTKPAQARRGNDWLLSLGNFDGYIDELRISNTLRTDELSVAALKAAPTPTDSKRSRQRDAHHFVSSLDKDQFEAEGEIFSDQTTRWSPLGVSVIDVDGTPFIEVTYNRPSGSVAINTCQYTHNNLFYSIETSPDLAETESWHSSPLMWHQFDAPEHQADGTETVRIVTRADAADSLYVRLRMQTALND